MRIAYFSPLPPSRSGVADYSRELLPHLAKWAEIHVFGDRADSGSHDLPEGFPVYHYADFERLSHKYQASVYHMGNDLSHEYILETMLRFPSFVVLHDVLLHHLAVALTVGRGNPALYVREMGYAYGRDGMATARAACRAGSFPHSQYPLCQRMVDVSLGVIVHSKYAAHVVRDLRPRANLAVIPQGTPPAETGSREESRRRLGLDPREFIVASLGFATPEKRLEPALTAFACFLRSNPNSRFLVVGEVPPWFDLARVIESLGLKDRVLLTGRVPMSDFYGYAEAADACLALRYPTCGETSAALLRAMAVGRPVIVSRVGSFAELPEGTCLPVPVDEGEVEGIWAALERLAGDEGLRRRLGRQARAYVEDGHPWPRSAEMYYRFIRDTVGSLCSWPLD